MLVRFAATTPGTIGTLPDIQPLMPTNQTDTERFEALFAAHRAAILAFAIRRADSAEEAADVVSDTFTVAWRRLDDVPNGDGALPWLYGTARKALANTRRAGQRRDALAVRAGNELAVALDAAAAKSLAVGPAHELSDASRSSLMGLREEEREALLLVAWEGLKPRDVAQVLGISPITARTRIHRARRNFVAGLPANSGTHASLNTTISQEESS
jgi:RNA polymerase sigma-70 factor (ECF subfamily)